MVRLRLGMAGHRLSAAFRDPVSILQDYRQLFGPDFERNADHARRIASPTLIVGGTADQLFDRQAAEETAALIPGARLRLFAKETHMLPIEKPDPAAAAIGEFLRCSARPISAAKTADGLRPLR
jgi:pimeloyl-ACP methyl ester carboxylesterase